ncbi:hypothetical protein BJV82DRAFT_664268 [Fennellomyces sp. T-0311]|nr:hypothetical protein BJV82DRAFT_664268 [Fennellomyces sp. T-0311]
MATRWSKGKPLAPTTIFASTNSLSPRQIANKALSLGYKKLDRDTKRTRPKYDFRIRVLLYNTITAAENVLNKRTRRTNRRVMAAEDEDDDHVSVHTPPPVHHDRSPLSIDQSDQQQEQESNDEEEQGPMIHHHPRIIQPVALPRDCKPIVMQSMNTPIESM